MSKTIKEWADSAHALAAERGDWDKEAYAVMVFAEAHGDLARALQEYKEERPMLYCEWMRDHPCEACDLDRGTCDSANAVSRPCGMAAECARAVLRLLNLLGGLTTDVDGVLEAVHKYDRIEWKKKLHGSGDETRKYSVTRTKDQRRRR